MKLKLLIAVVAMVSGVFSSGSIASDVRDNWDITKWEDGIPKTAVYSDSNMRIKLTAQENLPREGGGWKVEFVTAEIYSSKNLLGRTENRLTRKGDLNILGLGVRLWSENVRQINSQNLAVKNIPVLSLWCGTPAFTQFSTSMGAIHLSFPIQEIESMEYHKLLDRWRDSSPVLRKSKSQPIPSAASRMDESDLDALSEEQRSQEGEWYQPESCTQAFEKYLERGRQKEAERQAQLDYSSSLIEEAHSQGDVMLVTNQKLLECKFEPQCETQVLEEVDVCKKTKEGKYIESCIRAIEALK